MQGRKVGEKPDNLRIFCLFTASLMPISDTVVFNSGFITSKFTKRVKKMSLFELKYSSI